MEQILRICRKGTGSLERQGAPRTYICGVLFHCSDIFFALKIPFHPIKHNNKSCGELCLGRTAIHKIKEDWVEQGQFKKFSHRI